MDAPAPSPSRANLVLATLFLGMFVIGGTELLAVGVLDLIAADLRVSIPAAGLLVTVYALGLAVGGPVLTAATIRLDKRTVLAGALALFIVSNLVAVLTGSYGLLLVARILTGAFQGLFIAAAFAAGTAVVPPARAGRAMAVVVSGVAVSGAVGVPLGTLVGQALGWRGAFAAATGLAAAALVATLAVVPSVPGAGAGARGQVRSAVAPRVLAVLALTGLIFASVYAALTYIVPFLQTVTGVSGGLISVFLLAYGAATAAGSFGGGRFADADAARALVVGTAGVAGCLLALYLVGAVPVLVALALLAVGGFAMGMAPSMQYRVVSLAGPGGAFAQSLPASAANVGIALGSFAGGAAVGAFNTSAAVIAGLVIAVIAIPVAWATSFLTPPAVEVAAAPPPIREPALCQA
ncbi:MFS transporter [Phytohabitans houttuyneae]|uniref:MFS transporter n=1 Tax=Phytohabitans houttuyneae TaxID=1076126 RepID=A0A6V8KJG3_9ACTN|nr:MFS transporter [Phytohabitans houttuyneae]GFJ84004.1 MFS transporter [Phytohabitans houttuyneae]